MAAVTRVQNLAIVNSGDTLTGPAYFYIIVTGGGSAAQATVNIGGQNFLIKAQANTTYTLPDLIKLDRDQVATFTLSGPASSQTFLQFPIEET